MSKGTSHKQRIAALVSTRKRLTRQAERARRDYIELGEELGTELAEERILTQRLQTRVADLTGERDRARATAVALEQDGAMAEKALRVLAEAVVDEVDHNMPVYQKALAVVRMLKGAA